MAIKIYTKQFAGILPDIFKVHNRFMRTFGGSLQVKDGVADTDTFLTLKTIDADVVIQDYSTDENVAFGTGTGNTTRFGPRKEIKAVESQVPYESPLAIHEGIDNVTVNDVPSQVVAERLEKSGIAWAEHVNGLLSKKLSESAGATVTGELTLAGVSKAFADARKILLNNKVNTALGRVAYVTADVYNLLLESNLTTTAKNSNTNIDTGEVRMFKGFILDELPDEYFQEGENIYFAVDNVGIAGVGISMTRTIDSEDFYGVAIQSVAKYGTYLPAANKKAVVKATLTAPLAA